MTMSIKNECHKNKLFDDTILKCIHNTIFSVTITTAQGSVAI